MSERFGQVEQAIKDIAAGRPVVVVDDEDRENEGDLTIAAEKVTPEVINFMARYGRGLICLPMTGERLDELRIPLMVRDEQNDAKFGTAFCVPIEAKKGTTTGISNADQYDLLIRVITQILPAEGGLSAVRTQAEATGHAIATSGQVAQCSSTGALEAQIAHMISDQAVRAAAK